MCARVNALTFVVWVATTLEARALPRGLRVVNIKASQPNIGNAETQQLSTETYNLGFHEIMSRKYRTLNEEAVQNFSDGLQEGVSVIVPGFGDYQRASVVKNNIKWLMMQNIDFECRIYVYLDELTFPLNASAYAPCELIRHPGFFMEHILAFPLARTRKKYVLLNIDGVRLGPEVQLPRMLSVMSANQLVHAAPSFSPEGEGCLPCMYHEPSAGVGRFMDFVELQMNVFTRESFACMQDIIDTDNKLGWGVAKVMPKVCKGNLGILDEMLALKAFHSSYDHEEAHAQMEKYLSKYPDVVIPTGRTLGLLSNV